MEPEGYQNDEIYVNGFSTSLPADVQEKAIKTVMGLEKAKILRLGYAVEYDYFHPNQLNYRLELPVALFSGSASGPWPFSALIIINLPACYWVNTQPYYG